MKISGLFWVALPVILSAGCINSHQGNVAYAPVETAPLPPPAGIVEQRVSAERAPMHHSVGAEDLATAHAVREIMAGNIVLPNFAENVMATIHHGVVTLRGGVGSDHERDELVDRIRRLPGVRYVNDEMELELR